MSNQEEIMRELWAFRPDVASQGADLSGMAVQALDGGMGKVREVVDRDSRTFLVVDTGPWIFGKTIKVPAGLVSGIDRDAGVVLVDRAKDDVKGAPEQEGELIDDAAHEEAIARYYGFEGADTREATRPEQQAAATAPRDLAAAASRPQEGASPSGAGPGTEPTASRRDEEQAQPGAGSPHRTGADTPSTLERAGGPEAPTRGAAGGPPSDGPQDRRATPAGAEDGANASPPATTTPDTSARDAATSLTAKGIGAPPEDRASEAPTRTSRPGPHTSPERSPSAPAPTQTTRRTPDTSPERSPSAPAPTQTSRRTPDTSPEQSPSAPAPTQTSRRTPETSPERSPSAPAPTQTTRRTPDTSPERSPSAPAPTQTSRRTPDTSPEQSPSAPAPTQTSRRTPETSPERSPSAPAPTQTTRRTPDTSPEQSPSAPAPTRTSRRGPDTSPEQSRSAPAPARTRANEPSTAKAATPVRKRAKTPDRTESDRATAKRTEQKPRTSRNDQPFARYDALTAAEVITRLRSLSQSELTKVERYERRGDERQTILKRVAALREKEPWRGYDGANVKEVKEKLAKAKADRATAVRDYERRHRNRTGVMDAARRRLEDL